MTKKRKRAIEVAEFAKTLIETRSFRMENRDILAYDDKELTNARLRDISLDGLAKLNLRGCAKGALLISHLILFEDTTLQQLGKWEEVYESPRKVFGTKNADLIEAAFDGDIPNNSCYSNPGKAGEKKLRRAYGFHRLYGDPATRMKKILDNVIRNKGKFVP